MKSENPTQN